MKKAIVTVYYPDCGNADNVKKISEQVDQVIVCDNSPDNNQALFLNDKIEYIYFGENLGLSSAFNRVLKVKENWDADDYILFFDQDSTIEVGHVEGLISEYNAARDMGIDVGCIGPVFFNQSNGLVEVPKMKTTIRENLYVVQSIITSSMLTSYRDLEEVGFWNEKIFLDMADWDLCWRMMHAGKKCCMTENVVLNHTLGNGEKKIGIFRLREGSTIRDYYQTRECLYLFKEAYTPVKYKYRFLLMLTVRAGMRLLFLGDRRKRLHYIRRGIKDYRNNVHGVYR